jgi:hypothetical protein
VILLYRTQTKLVEAVHAMRQAGIPHSTGPSPRGIPGADPCMSCVYVEDLDLSKVVEFLDISHKLPKAIYQLTYTEVPYENIR